MAIEFEKKSAPPVHFNEMISIGKIGKMVKNEFSATTGILSFSGGEMIKISGLVTEIR